MRSVKYQADYLIEKYGILPTEQVDKTELQILLRLLEEKLQSGVHGSVVEFGCYLGTTSLFIRRLLDEYNSDVEYHVYDSFEGLPNKTPEDMSAAGEQFVTGELHARKKEFIANFKKAKLKPPIIHKGWFSDLEPTEVPDDIFFAFFDGDFYQSIKDSFAATKGKISQKALVLVDDYVNEALPGAAKATDEWCHSNIDRVKKISVRSSLAIIDFV